MISPARIHAFALLAIFPSAHAFADEVPTPVVEVTDTYHGVTVRDPYRWLEDSAAPDVQAWTSAQNARTHSRLDAIASRAGIKARLTSLITRGSASFSSFRARGEGVFAILNDPAKQQPIVVVLAAA